jgi:Flp pilus assembly protein TadG
MRTATTLRDERGQAMTEFAVAFPIVALLLFGVIQFGLVFNTYLTVTDAVRAGARKAAVSRMDPNASSSAISAVRNSAGDLDQTQLTVNVNSTWDSGTDVTVSASYPWKVDLLGLVFASGNLKSTTTERVE